MPGGWPWEFCTINSMYNSPEKKKIKNMNQVIPLLGWVSWLLTIDGYLPNETLPIPHLCNSHHGEPYSLTAEAPPMGLQPPNKTNCWKPYNEKKNHMIFFHVGGWFSRFRPQNHERVWRFDDFLPFSSVFLSGEAAVRFLGRWANPRTSCAVGCENGYPWLRFAQR